MWTVRLGIIFLYSHCWQVVELWREAKPVWFTRTLSLDCFFWNFSNLQKSWKNDTCSTGIFTVHLLNNFTIHQLSTFCYVCTFAPLHPHRLVALEFCPQTYFSLKHLTEPVVFFFNHHAVLPLFQKKHSLTRDRTIWITLRKSAMAPHLLLHTVYKV